MAGDVGGTHDVGVGGRGASRFDTIEEIADVGPGRRAGVYGGGQVAAEFVGGDRQV